MLKRIPSQNDLSRLYYELAQIGAPAMGEKKRWPYMPGSKEQLIALTCDMVRYDPRLLGILIIFLKNNWKILNPLALREAIKKCDLPQIMGVVSEFVKNETRDKEVTFYFEYLMKGFHRVSWQLFFIGTSPLGSHRMDQAAQRSLREYRKWGFLSIEKPVVDLRTKRQAGSLDRGTRLRILSDLLKGGCHVTVGQYLDAVDHSMTRQQALADFKAIKHIGSAGYGRGAYWFIKK